MPEYQHYICCPYCGNQNEIAGLEPGEETDEWCVHCGRMFTVTTNELGFLDSSK
jgi:uncharacterized Zn-finger protein